MERVGDLQVDEDLRWQEREWKTERVGLLLLVLLVVVALVGVVGHGPLSWTTASSADDRLEVTYERFGRRGGSQGFVVRSPRSAVSASRWQFDIEREYLAAFTVNDVTPQPDSVELVEGAFRYSFVPPERGDLEAHFDVTPQGLWRVSGSVELPGGDASVSINQFYFP